jgi:hypothetical protein
MIIVITSDGDKRHALRRLISPFSSNIRCQLGKNNFEKSSTSQVRIPVMVNTDSGFIVNT